MLLTRNETKFEQAVAVSECNPDALLEWIDHPELAEAARLYYAARWLERGLTALAQRQLEIVLGMKASSAAATFCRDHPLSVEIDVMGLPVQVDVDREGGALLLAGIYLDQRDWFRFDMVLPSIDDERAKTAMAAVSAFEQGLYHDVVYRTRGLSGKSCVALDGLAMVVRACAFREWGDVIEAERAMSDAYLAAWVHRDTPLYDLYELELTRTLAAKRRLYGANRDIDVDRDDD
ncbi:hypothetical protein [Jongsikchunia kroppenstedtii]|uniref:hypothetical protein n=1 Tax=Jongsikchunia kroppenstedtii TaxID=1121721 RepID=UPI000361015E|nr:hypothetical protein [Jongsikchunia kroppenstedtii]